MYASSEITSSAHTLSLRTPAFSTESRQPRHGHTLTPHHIYESYGGRRHHMGGVTTRIATVTFPHTATIYATLASMSRHDVEVMKMPLPLFSRHFIHAILHMRRQRYTLAVRHMHIRHFREYARLMLMMAPLSPAAMRDTTAELSLKIEAAMLSPSFFMRGDGADTRHNTVTVTE